jgi:hypothetical protein
MPPSGYDALNLQNFVSPDSESFISSVRVRLFGSSGSVAIPATGSAAVLVFLPLVDPFGLDDGLFFESFGATVTPTLSDGALTISDQLLALRLSGSSPILPLATPVETTLVPRFVTSLQLQSTPPFVTARDLDQFARLTGIVLGLQGLTVQFALQLGFVNSNAAARNVTVNFWAIVRVIRGLRGA